jgi:hypothetical protein
MLLYVWLHTCYCTSGYIRVTVRLVTYVLLYVWLHTCYCTSDYIRVTVRLVTYVLLYVWLHTCYCTSGYIHVTVRLVTYMSLYVWLHTCYSTSDYIHMLITAAYKWARCDSTTLHCNKPCMTSHRSECTNVVFKHFKCTIECGAVRVSLQSVLGTGEVYKALVGEIWGKETTWKTEA